MKSRCLAALAAVMLIAGCGQTHPSQSAMGSVHPAGWGKPAPVTARLSVGRPVPTAAMFDTITLGTVPGDPFALAGYTAGRWPTFLPLRHRWPQAHTVSIAISARDHADCLDVEPGDATPSEVAGWVRADIKAGWRKPCVYSSWWEFHDQVTPALAQAHISRSQVWEWDADYTYWPHIDAGFDATQWTDRALGRNLDESLVTRAFLSIAHPALTPAPKPKPKPSPAPRPRPKPHHKPKPCDRLCALKHERGHLRKVLLEQHCRVKHPNRHCRGVLRSGARVNRLIHRLGGR